MPERMKKPTGSYPVAIVTPAALQEPAAQAKSTARERSVAIDTPAAPQEPAAQAKPTAREKAVAIVAPAGAGGARLAKPTGSCPVASINENRRPRRRRR